MGFEAFVVALTMSTKLWCMKVDPIRVDTCAAYVVECILDEGEKHEKWCQDDYMDVVFYSNED